MADLGAFAGESPPLPTQSSGTGGVSGGASSAAAAEAARDLQALSPEGDRWSRHSVRLTNSANQSISDATDTAVTFDTDTYDFDDIHSTTTNPSRITMLLAGKYLLTANIDWEDNATGYRQLKLLHNATTAIALTTRVGSATAGANRQTIVTEYDFAAGDYLELFVLQTSGGALNVLTNNDFSPVLTAVLIG